jgi:hypothetical protein
MVEPPSRCSRLISQSTEAHGISSRAPRHVTPQRGPSPSGGSLRRSHNEVQHGGIASATATGASWLQCGGDEPILATAEADAPPPISVTLSSDFVWRCLRLRAVDAHLALLPVLDQQLASPHPSLLQRSFVAHCVSSFARCDDSFALLSVYRNTLRPAVDDCVFEEPNRRSSPEDCFASCTGAPTENRDSFHYAPLTNGSGVELGRSRLEKSPASSSGQRRAVHFDE